MFRFVFALAAMLPVSLCFAETGPGLPRLFPRATPTPQRTAPPKSEPKPIANQPAATADAEPTVSEVDTAEIIRRGDRVTTAGRGPMGVEDQMIGEATAPPPDDSAKWFVSIIVDDSVESQALLYDLKNSRDLRAWVDLDEPKGSWAHCTIYRKGDQTQEWRWKGMRFSAYPVMLLQPPAKLRDEKQSDSWIWGDPKTVVWQFDGYDVRQADRAKKRADDIRNALTLYVHTLSTKRPAYANAGPRSRAVPPPTPGPRDTGHQQAEAGAAPPFSFPSGVQIPTSNPFPADPSQLVTPAVPQQVTAPSLAMELFSRAFGSGGFWVFILVGLKVFELYAARTPTKLDDQAVAFFRSFVESAQKNQASPIDPK